MKKIVVATVSLILAVGSYSALAQSAQPQRMILAEGASAPSYAVPRTVITVDITVEKQTVITGPYARFAQKFLGAMAPLTDKLTYSISDVTIDYSDPVRKCETVVAAKKSARNSTESHTDGKNGFMRSQPDRTSITDRSLEDMAREAANTIYTLRKRRFDLVSGEAGEHVYGEGLKAALVEMDRMENEYLALFLGKTVTEKTVHTFDVVPQGDKTNYIFARFTSEAGILPTSDLSGQPVALVLSPEGTLATPPARTDKRAVDYYRVPEYVNCRVMSASDELASRIVPVYQFGVTVAVPAGTK